MPDQPPAIVWFRYDLRLADNPALLAAASRGPVIPLFIWSPDEESPWSPGAASRWWLHQSLHSLHAALQTRGLRLILRQGDTLKILSELIAQTGAASVHWNRRYEPAIMQRDQRLRAALQKLHIDAAISSDALLFDPGIIRTQEGKPYTVFTAFWNTCSRLGEPNSPQPAPQKILAPSRWPDSLSLGDLHLQPAIHWTTGLEKNWTPGEPGATAQLQAFLRAPLQHYDTARDLPATGGTSRLSPHLHFGEISIRQIWSNLREKSKNVSPTARKSLDRFRTELGWREFAHHLLVHFPHTPDQPLREEFATFPWLKNPAHLRAWQKGATGYPIVDAGMRQLWHTGWMHNRVRMIAASFLVKDLLIPWQEGATWFWDTLVDADLANNTLGWQWTAGCGADAAPYFRIFNPTLQGEKFDPDGGYIRQWVPEISKLPPEWIHRPWEAPPLLLTPAGITLGETYPHPIIDHAAARKRALAALSKIKK